jgi:hypothetical protein
MHTFSSCSHRLWWQKNKRSSTSCVYLDISQEHDHQRSIQCHWNLHVPKEQAVSYQPDMSIKVNSASLQLLQDHQVWLVHNVPMLAGGVCPRQSPPLWFLIIIIICFHDPCFFHYLQYTNQPSPPPPQPHTTFWWETFVNQIRVSPWVSPCLSFFPERLHCCYIDFHCSYLYSYYKILSTQVQ